MPDEHRSRPSTTGATLALIAGVIYLLGALAIGAVGGGLYALFGHSVESASAGSPEGAAGAVFLELFGIAGLALVVIAGGLLLVGVVLVVLGRYAVRGRRWAATSLIVVFAVGIASKIALLVAWLPAEAILPVLASCLLDSGFIVFLVRDRRGQTGARAGSAPADRAAG
jgi:hypothetical protein